MPEGVDFLLGNDIACLTDNVQAPLMQSVITRPQAIAAQPPIVDIHAGSINTPAEVVDSDVIGLHDESEHLLQAGRYVKNLDCEAVQDREHLIKLQQQDANLIHVFEQVIDVDFPIGKAYFYVTVGLLMHHDIVRKTRQEADQIVIPRSLRTKILKMAHDIPAAGHLGIHKTKARL